MNRPATRTSRALLPRVTLLLLFLLHVASALAADPQEKSTTGQIGSFSLPDTRGAVHTAAEWRAAKCALLLFIDTECPVSNFYAPQMQRLANRYGQQRVVCFGVHCEPTTTAEVAAKHAQEYGLKFPILIDPEQQLARPAGARVTPEAVVVSPEGKVLYRGRIDDRYAADGKRRDQPRERDLEAALDAVLAGREPKVRETKAFGCPLPKLDDR